MVLVKIEPKEAVRFIKLRQSIPHSRDVAGTEEGSMNYVCAFFFFFFLAYMLFRAE